MINPLSSEKKCFVEFSLFASLAGSRSNFLHKCCISSSCAFLKARLERLRADKVDLEQRLEDRMAEVKRKDYSLGLLQEESKEMHILLEEYSEGTQQLL